MNAWLRKPKNRRKSKRFLARLHKLPTQSLEKKRAEEVMRHRGGQKFLLLLLLFHVSIYSLPPIEIEKEGRKLLHSKMSLSGCPDLFFFLRPERTASERAIAAEEFAQETQNWGRGKSEFSASPSLFSLSLPSELLFCLLARSELVSLAL